MLDARFGVLSNTAAQSKTAAIPVDSVCVCEWRWRAGGRYAPARMEPQSGGLPGGALPVFVYFHMLCAYTCVNTVLLLGQVRMSLLRPIFVFRAPVPVDMRSARLMAV
jgi:hypothetical protein